MGSTFVVFKSVTVCFCLIMKVFGLLFLLGSAYCGVPSCTTVWENKCWDEPRQQCNTVQVPNKVTTYEQKCKTVYEEQCKTEHEKVCGKTTQTKTDYVTKNKCDLEQEEQCHDTPHMECKTVKKEVTKYKMNRS